MVKKMNATKLIGVMGSGMIGTDPYEENAWSGSSRFFFTECDRQGMLQRAFGVEVENLFKVPLMLRNFSLNRDLWRQKFYLDTKYYALLSTRIVNALRADEQHRAILQIGGIYDLKPLLRNDRRVFSYHDGNLAQAIKSPRFPGGVSRSRVQRALDYEKRVCQNVDLIFTMSDYLRDSFINDYGVPEQKVRTIGAGINLDSMPRVANKDYNSKNLVFIGADFERKGGMGLLRAFAKARSAHPTAKLNIIGPRDLRIPSDLSGGVVYHGFLSKNDPEHKRQCEQVLASSSLFVMPSLYEPFGIAPLEAMAYAIPALLTDAWAFPEMVRPGVNGELVRCGDANDLADKIVDLLRNPDKLQAMGKVGRKFVLERFTWQSVVGNLRQQLSA